MQAVFTGLGGVDGYHRQWETGWCSESYQRGSLNKSNLFFSILTNASVNQKPAIFASMGPSFNQEAKGKKLYIEKLFGTPSISPSEKKVK